LFIRFHKLFITVFFIAIASYIRFKRQKYGIDIELEPNYLLAIALALGFGIEYGLAFILLPMLLTSFTGVSIGLFVNLMNKVIVVWLTLLFWNTFRNAALMILVATGLVLLTDILGFFIRKRFGQPILQIIQVLATNAILRFGYFSLFLDLIVRMIA
jgi:hypothetical protein